MPPHHVPGPPVVSLHGVRVDFPGRTALVDVDLDVAGGEVLVVTGPNGAGKTTLVEGLAGTRRPTLGRRASHAAVAFVPQRAAVADRLPVTVRDVVTVGTWRRGAGPRARPAQRRAEVDLALERLALTELARQPFGTLSGGQRQRALLAQGLACRADVLVLDEPTTGLDPESAGRIRSLVRAEAAAGTAVVCVSHDPGVVGAADRVVRLVDGRVVDDAAP